MTTKKIFKVSFPPNSFNDVYKEFLEVESSLREVSESIASEITTAAPDKPQQFMVRYADGVNWNPRNLGAGLYMYIGNMWMKFKLE